ncbi:MAG: amino acid export carrier protein [Corynebacterium kroppenstedtii]|uniref:Amino acid export carrier protein n=2 Tax=Corynebacterium kroppenstedtii TaxID=161879 RepID=A0A2W5UTX5_9CORY|nr:MAG: amino acid export carrier protein [Corynebacterium kroppenstedtii]
MNARLGSVNQLRHNTHNCTHNETNTPSPVQTALSTTPIACTIGSVVACHHELSSPSPFPIREGNDLFMDFVSGFSQAFRRVAGSHAPGSTAGGSNPVATIDAVKAAPAPSPLKPIDFTNVDEINAVLDLAARIGDVLLASGMSNGDVKAHMHAITETYGIHDVHVDITLNTLMLYTTMGPTEGALSAFRVVSKLSMDFARLEEIDVLVRRILTGGFTRAEAADELHEIVTAPPTYNSAFVLIMWGVFTGSVAFMIGGHLPEAIISCLSAIVIMWGSAVLAGHGLPLFFQNVFGGLVAPVPAALAYHVGQHYGIEVNPSVCIGAGIVAMLAGLTLVQALQDGITGAPVTASARFFEAALSTGAIIAGVAFGLNIASRLGIPLPGFEGSASTNVVQNVVITVSGALAGAFFAVACFARLRSTVITTVTTLIGAAIYYMILIPIGFGTIAASGMAATLIGLFGGLLSRRYMIPPLITAVSGITPLLPGFALYRGMYSLLNDRPSIGFSSMATAFAIATSLAAGVVLGEWIARRLRRPRIATAYRGVRNIVRRPLAVKARANGSRPNDSRTNGQRTSGTRTNGRGAPRTPNTGSVRARWRNRSYRNTKVRSQ